MGGVSNQRMWLPETTAEHNEKKPSLVILQTSSHLRIRGRNKMIFFKNENKNKNKNKNRIRV